MNPSEQEELESYADDVGLHQLEIEHFNGMSDARDVLKSIAYGSLFSAALRRATLHYHQHAEDRLIEERMLARLAGVSDDLFGFIGDPVYRREATLLAQRSVTSLGNGGAYFAVLDIENDRGDKTDGKLLSKRSEQLAEFANSMGVKPLEDFFGIGGRGSGDWFEPEQGLNSLRALLEHVSRKDVKIKDKRAIIVELRDLESVLVFAQNNSAKFHIEIDV